MSEVHNQSGEALESALRRFKRTLQQEHVINQIKRLAGHNNDGERTELKGMPARGHNRK
jgi:small subunit ribosomal protein S21